MIWVLSCLVETLRFNPTCVYKVHGKLHEVCIEQYIECSCVSFAGYDPWIQFRFPDQGRRSGVYGSPEETDDNNGQHERQRSGPFLYLHTDTDHCALAYTYMLHDCMMIMLATSAFSVERILYTGLFLHRVIFVLLHMQTIILNLRFLHTYSNFHMFL